MDEDFLDLIRRAADGDEAASNTLFERFAPHVRRIARIKLSNVAMRQRLDEEDVCQSVFGVFFGALRDGRFRVESVEDLRRLLAEVARKRVLKAIERHTAGKRDIAAQADLGDAEFDPASDESTPSVKVSREELVSRFLANLTEDERRALEGRRAGKSWEELAAELRTTADALRVRVGRIAKDARARLGIDVD